MKTHRHDLVVDSIIKACREGNGTFIKEVMTEFCLASNGFIHGYIDIVILDNEDNYHIYEIKTKDEDSSLGEAVRQINRYEYYLKLIKKVDKVSKVIYIEDYPDDDVLKSYAKTSGVEIINLK